MANKLAGQKMKFTKARTNYYSTDDEALKTNAVRQMAEVLAWAQGSGISEAEVTQQSEFPEEVRRVAVAPKEITEADADQFVKVVGETVHDQSGGSTIGSGAHCVYAYGYRCAPGRLKVGRCEGDVVTRISNQINTSTPDKPCARIDYPDG